MTPKYIPITYIWNKLYAKVWHIQHNIWNQNMHCNCSVQSNVIICSLIRTRLLYVYWHTIMYSMSCIYMLYMTCILIQYYPDLLWLHVSSWIMNARFDDLLALFTEKCIWVKCTISTLTVDDIEFSTWTYKSTSLAH